MEKIRVLVLGSTGMLGHVLFFYLKKNNQFDVFDVSFRKPLHPNSILCDVTNVKDLEKIVLNRNPKIIINCIGVLLKVANKNKANTIFLNAYFPHKLSEIAKKIDAKLIHISTDCIFDGEKGFYSEYDIPNPIDLYGRSKLLGEITYDNHLTLRTSIIGPEIKNKGHGLFHWFMLQKSLIQGFSNVYWGGVTTIQLAKVIEKSINLKLKGLFHVTNGTRISKYDLLQLLNLNFKSEKLDIIKYGDKVSDKSLTSKFNFFDDLILSYDDMVIEMKKFIEENKNYYKY